MYVRGCRRAHQYGASNNRPLNNGDIMELAHLPLTFTKNFCKLGTMKIKKKQLAKLAFRAYMIYSITADMIVIGGIVYIIFF